MFFSFKIFEPKENKEDAKAKKEIPKSTIKACQQIVDGLVNATMRLEGSEKQVKLVGCINALHLFAKVRPQLLINHAVTLEPYLNVKTNSSNLVQFISSIAEILEQVRTRLVLLEFIFKFNFFLNRLFRLWITLVKLS